jgi:hypothetical protein
MNHQQPKMKFRMRNLKHRQKKRKPKRRKKSSKKTTQNLKTP